MRLLPFSLLMSNGSFGRHGPWWISVVLSSVGNVPSWKRARSVGLSSVRSNSWTRPYRSTSCWFRRCWFRRCWLHKSSGFYSCRPPHCPVDSSSLVFFAAPEAYKRGRLFDGYITMNLNNTPFNYCSRHNWQLCIINTLQSTVFPRYNGVFKISE